MKIYHILNGDCLAQQLAKSTINQDFIICRECMIDGDLKANTLAEFWELRAEFISSNYHSPKQEYFNKTVKEFEKLNQIPNNSEICLWFENDLFCQANMWFIISLLSNKPNLNIYRVFPINQITKNQWTGFGKASGQVLENAYQSKVKFSEADLTLGKNLWIAYQNHDLERLKELSKTPSKCFSYLEEVCLAHIERFPIDDSLPRPNRVVKEILKKYSTSFKDIFIEFSKREGIYGFGDLQFKSIYDKQINNK